MTQNCYNNILSKLTRQPSFEISFTSAWKGYEVESKNADHQTESEISEWLYEELIHTLVDLGMDSEKMIFKFYKDKDLLLLDGTFIFRNDNWTREDFYRFSDLIADPIINLIWESCKLDKESIDLKEIELNFHYSSQHPIFKDLKINYKNIEVEMTNEQLKIISDFLLNIVQNWDASENRTANLNNVYTEIYAWFNSISVETHGNASFRITPDSICLI